MTKAGAIAILTTIFLGLSGWTMTSVSELRERVVRNETERDNLKELVKRMEAKIDILIERVR